MVARGLCVAATLSLLVASAAAAAESPLPGGRAVVATASVTPTTHLFGDAIVARVDVVFDPAEFDPERLRVRLRFEPYEAVGGIRETRRRSGRLVHVRYEAALRCLHVGCLAPRTETILGGQEEGRAERKTVQFPPAAVLYGPQGNAELLLSRLFPPVQVVSRINTAQASGLAPGAQPGSRGAFAASLEPPPMTYRIRPGLLAGLAVGAALLLLVFPLVVVGRLAHGRWRAARGWRPLPPLERALVLVDWSARREDAGEDRRKALEALAVVAEQRGARPLADTTRALAWAEEPPPPELAGEAGSEARRTLDGGSRERSA